MCNILSSPHLYEPSRDKTCLSLVPKSETQEFDSWLTLSLRI